jgi:hypothetical protein
MTKDEKRIYDEGLRAGAYSTLIGTIIGWLIGVVVGIVLPYIF